VPLITPLSKPRGSRRSQLRSTVQSHMPTCVAWRRGASTQFGFSVSPRPFQIVKLLLRLLLQKLTPT
jgi:hypothetical protein